MSDPLHVFKCNLERDIVIDSLIPANTSGSFCDLLTGTHPTAGKLALKRPRGSYDERLIARIEIEARVWASLKHSRILRFLGIWRIDEEIYFVSGFAENGSLPVFLKRKPDVDRLVLVAEIAEGLAYLHQCGIIHGDLKGNNVLISKGDHVMLCDFGLAKHVTSRTSTSLRGVGSIPWQSPELLQNACRRSFESDVYAFGITVYEVLSGKEPYSGHTGIVSIITGVVFNGERPPKEPRAALDGTSYLQLWNEASQCWAENSALRPRIIDVLKRLDRRRAESLVTSQQISLEATLGTSTRDSSTFKRDLEPGSSQDEDTVGAEDTLGWAHSIRIRMHALLNSQQLVCRLPPEIVAQIILFESAWWDRGRNDRVFLDGHHYHPRDRSWIFTAFVERCAVLRLVCKAWRDAIDSSPNLTRFIVVNEQRNNIPYVQRYNHDCLLECFLNPGNRSARDKLPSLLGPLTERLYALNIDMTDKTIEPVAFPKLQVFRLFSQSSSLSGWGVDPLRMVHANPGLIVLVIDFPDNPFDKAGVKKPTPPRSRVKHSSLQVVRLTGSWDPYKSDILRFLELDRSVQLTINAMQPASLEDPDSALKKLMHSLGRKEDFGVIRGQLDITVESLGFHLVRFMWSETGRFLPGEAFSLLISHYIASSAALAMVRELLGSGIVETVRLCRGRDVNNGVAGCILEKATRRELLRCLDSVKQLKIDVGFANWLLPTLVEYKDHQFLCPHLTELECFGEHPIATWWGRVIRKDSLVNIPSRICRLIKKRQSGTHPGPEPAKLRRIGVPLELMDGNYFKDPTFDGIDIYPVDKPRMTDYAPPIEYLITLRSFIVR